LRLIIIPPALRGRILPYDALPEYPHIALLAPPHRPGSAAELLTGAQDNGCSVFFMADAVTLEREWRRWLPLIRACLGQGVPVALCCQNRRDRSEAKRRLMAIAPAGYSIRE